MANLTLSSINTYVPVQYYHQLGQKGLLAKRVLDIVVSSLMLIALSPVLVLVALAIKAESAGSLFFKQERVGLNGKHFTMWKFRSMFKDAEARRAQLEVKNEMQEGVLFKMKHDPRVTRVGALIRKTSIDELPQLLNVLQGSMSLVGPRPPLPSEVAHYSANDRKRFQVQPGITCIWQVSGRSDIPFKEQVTLDIDYIHQRNIWLDIKLLLLTIPAVLLCRGAY